VLKQVEIFLPDLQSNEQQNTSFLQPVIALIDSLIAEKPERLEVDGIPPEKVLCESDKRDKIAGDSNVIASIAEKLLPRLFKSYEDSISPSLRQKSLSIIDKIISFMDA